MEVNNIKLSSRASDASSGGTELAEQVFSSGNSAKGAESAASTPPLVVRNNSHPHESSEPIEKAGSPSNQARTPAVRAKTSAKVGIPVTRTKEPVEKSIKGKEKATSEDDPSTDIEDTDIIPANIESDSEEHASGGSHPTRHASSPNQYHPYQRASSTSLHTGPSMGTMDAFKAKPADGCKADMNLRNVLNPAPELQSTGEPAQQRRRNILTVAETVRYTPQETDAALGLLSLSSGQGDPYANIIQGVNTPIISALRSSPFLRVVMNQTSDEKPSEDVIAAASILMSMRSL